MARYSLFIEDGTIIIDGTTVFGVDYTGVPANVQSVQWYDVEGYVETFGDPITGQKAPNQIITDITPYQSYITYGENVIYAEQNPVTFWSLADGNIYEGIIYNSGQPLVIYAYPQPTTPPLGFTDVQPIGSSSAYNTWQFNGTSWIASPFPISLDLVGAQDYLTKLVQANASALVNNQLSSYDAAQIAAAADPDLLEPRYKAVNLYPTVGDYRTALGAQTSVLFADIAAATAVNQLYVFDPTINEPPNYTP